MVIITIPIREAKTLYHILWILRGLRNIKIGTVKLGMEKKSKKLIFL